MAIALGLVFCVALYLSMATVAQLVGNIAIGNKSVDVTFQAICASISWGLFVTLVNWR